MSTSATKKAVDKCCIWKVGSLEGTREMNNTIQLATVVIPFDKLCGIILIIKK